MTNKFLPLKNSISTKFLDKTTLVAIIYISLSLTSLPSDIFNDLKIKRKAKG